MPTIELRGRASGKQPAHQTTQINTRINQELKQRGDAAFAAAGLTSSEAIRTLYEFAAAHELQPELILQRFASPSDNEKIAREKRERGLAAIDCGGVLYAEALRKLGVTNPDATILSMSYDQLKELAFAEKYEREA